MTVTIELSGEQAAKLEASARSEGLTVPDLLHQMIEQRKGGSTASPTCDRPLQTAADIVLRRMGNVPDKIMDQMPKDGASEHDHYIYGLPKKGQ